MHQRISGISAVAVSMLLLAGCAPSGAPQAAETSTPRPLPEKCLQATQGAIGDLQDDIAATLGGDVEFTGHGVIKSQAGDEFWMIAIEFEEEGRGASRGTWGTLQDPTVNEHIAYVAVDDMAPLVSSYHQPVDFVGVTSVAAGAVDCIPL